MAARPRAAAQLALAFPERPHPERPGHGGARKGAGRPRKPGAESHRRRPSVSPRHPLHVTLRVAAHVWNLRSQRCFRPLHAAFDALRQRPGARITHFSVQGNHVHLVVEADDRRAFSRALRALTVRVARGLQRVMGRKGRVLAARTHARALRTPTEVRNVLRYVLANHARHVPGAAVADAFSSAPVFRHWRAVGLPGVEGAAVRYALPGLGPPVAAPRAWLLRRGFVAALEAPRPRR